MPNSRNEEILTAIIEGSGSQDLKAPQSREEALLQGVLQKLDNLEPDPEVITQAVDDWLDDHPEATTTVEDGAITYAKLNSDLQEAVDDVSDLKTEIGDLADLETTDKSTLVAAINEAAQSPIVEDGSLTQEKFSDELQKKTIKEFLTPEMFGAIGDGVTDDTNAIQTMLASGNKFFEFGNKTYKISGSLDVTEAYTEIRFNNTKFTVTHSGNYIEYVIAFKNQFIHTIGLLSIYISRHAYIGIWLQNAKYCEFDSFFVNGAIIWGVYMNDRTGGGSNIGLTFNKLFVAECGFSLPAKGKYSSNSELLITEIDYTKYTISWTDELKSVIFGDNYRQVVQLIDDSDYTFSGPNGTLENRYVFSSSLDRPITLDGNDTTQGVYAKGTSTNFRSSYVDGDDGRKLWIPVGGAVKFGSVYSEGCFHIGQLITATCSKAFDCNFPYGGTIDSFIAESCLVLITCRNIIWEMNIGYLYAESIGYQFITSNKKSIYLISADVNTKITISTATFNLLRENMVIINKQDGHVNPTLFLQKQYYRSLCSTNIKAGYENFAFTVSELSPRELTINTSFFVNTQTPIITIDLENIDNYTIQGFATFTVYVKNTATSASQKRLRFGLSTKLVNAGYTLNGAVDGILTVDGSLYGNNFFATVVLFGTTFYVKAGALVYINNANAAQISTDIPAGGTAGQFLVKASNTDYDCEWITVPTANGVNF